MFRSLGPRGDVGSNPNMVAKSLAPLEVLADLVDNRGEKKARVFTNCNGEQWLASFHRSMGGRTQANRSRRKS